MFFNRTLSFITLSNILDYRVTDLSYMVVYDCASSLCVTALAGFKDGPMLPLGLVHAAQVDDISVQVMLRTIS
jgi:hypothetical protein